MLKDMNLTPPISMNYSKNTMVIEDSVHGIQSGLSANAKMVALTGSVDVKDMPPAHKIINSLNEIDDDFINSLFKTL